MGRVVSLAEAAAISGRSQNTLRAWLRQGAPGERDPRGAGWRIDIGRLMRWREERVAAVVLRANGAIGLDEARRRRQAALASLAEIELAEKRRDCISIAAAREAWSGLVANFRTGMLAIPAKISPVLAAESDEFVVRAVLDKEIEAALLELSRGDEVASRNGGENV